MGDSGVAGSNMGRGELYAPASTSQRVSHSSHVAPKTMATMEQPSTTCEGGVVCSRVTLTAVLPIPTRSIHNKRDCEVSNVVCLCGGAQPNSHPQRDSSISTRSIQDRGDSGVSMAVCEGRDFTHVRHPHAASLSLYTPLRAKGTRVYAPLCGRAWSAPTSSIPRWGAAIPTRSAEQRGDSGVSAGGGNEATTTVSPWGVPVPTRDLIACATMDVGGGGAIPTCTIH